MVLSPPLFQTEISTFDFGRQQPSPMLIAGQGDIDGLSSLVLENRVIGITPDRLAGSGYDGDLNRSYVCGYGGDGMVLVQVHEI
jgi:hypothetical protein